MILDELTPPILNQAVELYLAHAYDSDAARAAHRRAFAPGATPAEILSRLEDETDSAPDAHHFFSLRLGSEEYPHMKIVLWEAFYHGEYVLAVDTHDGFRFDTNAPDYEEWLALKDRNRVRKLAIEEAWHGAGLPTMRRLKEESLSRTGRLRAFRGAHVLLVDDDHDAAAIVRMILEAAGCRCAWVRSAGEAREWIRSARTPVALALVDIVLSDGHGLEVVKALRAEPQTQEALVYLTSAMSRSEVRDDGADGYLRKPFNAAALNRLVDKALTERHAGETIFLDRAVAEEGAGA